MNDLFYDLFGRSEKEIEFEEAIQEIRHCAVMQDRIQLDFLWCEKQYYETQELLSDYEHRENQAMKKLMNIAFGKIEKEGK